ncbi:MAG: serpin family protein [candidate division Zixibacteria bacterium]|nr:serpin family protein [candidate division Zixibacteria bacterium]
MQNIKFALILLTLPLLFTQCGNDPVSARQALASLNVSEKKLVASTHVFGFDLFGRIAAAQPGKNVFISPLSASMALGMALNGADGTTETAMRETLGLTGLSAEDANAAYRHVIDLLLSLDPKVQMELANSIWYRKEYTFESAFLNANKTYFSAQVQGLDFDSPSVKDTINKWVSDHTHGRIPDIVDGISPQTVMFLINAIYFKGTWAYRFEKNDTRQESFYPTDDVTISVPMMRQMGRFGYLETENFQAVELPYGNKEFCMTVLLPNPSVAIDDFIGTITPELWDDWTSRLVVREADIALPRFKFSYERTLNDDLMALGMGVAFSSTEADFTRMYPPGELFISNVKQKAFVEVNEEGTEAAAATSVEVSVTSIGDTVAIRVDRPFVFAIRERQSGTIMFVGRVIHPKFEG